VFCECNIEIGAKENAVTLLSGCPRLTIKRCYLLGATSVLNFESVTEDATQQPSVDGSGSADLDFYTTVSLD
jgi:hypothetical protein